MRVMLSGLIMGLLIFCCSPVNAKPSCQNLRTMMADLDMLGNAVGSTQSTSLDGELWDLIGSARYLASVEGDQAVSIAADDMLAAWNGKDQDLYVRSADNLAGRLQYFIGRDC